MNEHEWGGRRVLSPNEGYISFMEMPRANTGELIGDAIYVKTSMFHVKIPADVGIFNVTSECGRFKGEMRIEQCGTHRVLTHLFMSAPIEEAAEDGWRKLSPANNDSFIRFDGVVCNWNPRTGQSESTGVRWLGGLPTCDWRNGLEDSEISFLYRVAHARGDKEPTIEDVKGMRRLEAKLDEIIAEQQCDQPAIVKGNEK